MSLSSQSLGQMNDRGGREGRHAEKPGGRGIWPNTTHSQSQRTRTPLLQLPPPASLRFRQLLHAHQPAIPRHFHPREPTRRTYDGLYMHYHTRAEKQQTYWPIKYAWYTDDSKRCREAGSMSVRMDVSTVCLNYSGGMKSRRARV